MHGSVVVTREPSRLDYFSSPTFITSAPFFLFSYEPYVNKDLDPNLCKPKIKLIPPLLGEASPPKT